MAKRGGRKRLSRRDEAMLTRDELRETEDCFFDASPYASDSEWSSDTPPRIDDSKYAPRPARDCGRIMVIGFGVIRI
jgi:hypothetical protein